MHDMNRIDKTDYLHRLGKWEQRVFQSIIGRKHVAQDTNRVFEEQLTFGQRVADHVASFGGSWTFITLFLAVMFAWIILNAKSAAAVDPFPFILLNLILSCLAALQAPVIMMSQNRQASKDRLEAHHDYEVNLKAELEIMTLHAKLDEMREQHMVELRSALARQIEILQSINSKLGGESHANPQS